MPNDFLTEQAEVQFPLVVEQVGQNELPGIVSEKMCLLNTLGQKCESATAKAENAHALATSAQEKSAGLGHKKEAIEALQEAGVLLADAVVSETEAQGIIFACLTDIAEITKYLFGLGVSNLALNRSVVKELELKLSGASSEALSELAKQETLNVIRQLKAQEDILVKQEELEKRIRHIWIDVNHHDHNGILRRHEAEIKALAEARSAGTDEKLYDELAALAACFEATVNKLSLRLKIAYAVGGLGLLLGGIAIVVSVLI